MKVLYCKLNLAYSLFLFLLLAFVSFVLLVTFLDQKNTMERMLCVISIRKGVLIPEKH